MRGKRKLEYHDCWSWTRVFIRASYACWFENCWSVVRCSFFRMLLKQIRLSHLRTPLNLGKVWHCKLPFILDLHKKRKEMWRKQEKEERGKYIGDYRWSAGAWECACGIWGGTWNGEKCEWKVNCRKGWDRPPSYRYVCLAFVRKKKNCKKGIRKTTFRDWEAGRDLFWNLGLYHAMESLFGLAKREVKIKETCRVNLFGYTGRTAVWV